MTKQGVAIVFILSDLICTLSVWISFISKSRFKTAIINVTGAGALTTLAYTFTLLFNDYGSMNVSYGLYFFSMDWLCAALFFYMLFYGFPTITKKRMRNLVLVLGPVILADSLSQIFNIWTKHSIRYELIYSENGDLLFSLHPLLPFQIHLGICYVLVGTGILFLIVKMITSSRIYRAKYFSILALLLFIVLFNVFYLVGEFNIDFSILGYSFCSILLAFYTIYLMPKQLTNHMAGSLIQYMNSQVFIFDDYGYKIFENDLAQKVALLEVKSLQELVNLLQISLTDIDKEFREEVTTKWNGVAYDLSVRIQTMSEHNMVQKRKIIGTYVIIDDITQQKRERADREYRATHDMLTGFYNRDYFLVKAAEMVQKNPDIPYAIAMTNISQFTLYNEIFGKKAGDMLLISLSRSFRENIDVDKMVFGRYEADRFVACLPLEQCSREAIREKGLDEPVYSNNFRIINYVGVCGIKDPNEKLEVVCQRAVIALSAIKDDGKLHYIFYDPRMKDKMLRERELTALFPRAMKEGEIQIYIQPQMNQMNGNVIGGEALARWIQKDGTMISPGEFIPILEERGLVTELDVAVWRMACEQIREFQKRGKKMSISVNISTQDFYKLDTYQVFTKMIQEYEIPPESLKLEITESDFLKNIQKHITVIKRLQEKGFTIEMDDFGSGYSSLNSLKDIPVNVLKMDLKFLDKIDTRKRGQIIIRNVIKLARELGIAVIAEGVETKEQAEVLRNMGCRYIQGYYYGKPMTPDKFALFCSGREYEELSMYHIETT